MMMMMMFYRICAERRLHAVPLSTATHQSRPHPSPALTCTSLGLSVSSPSRRPNLKPKFLQIRLLVPSPRR